MLWCQCFNCWQSFKFNMGRLNYLSSLLNLSRRGRMVVEFTTTCAIVVYHHYWMLELFRQCPCYIFFHFIIGYWKKPSWVAIVKKKIWLWSSSVIKIVKMKYNRINIKLWLASTSFKIYLDILSNLYITFTIFYYNTISLWCTFCSCSS